MAGKEIDTVVDVPIPMKIHLGSSRPTRSGLYGIFLRGVGKPGEITFHQTWFSARHNQWFNHDCNRKSMSGLNDRLDIVAWAECPRINLIVSDYAVLALDETTKEKE